jgi:hypothetical protein
MTVVKLSVSISEDDVEFMDQYAEEHGGVSRSGVLQQALALLRARELGDDYADAWDEWEDEAGLWETTSADGLADRTSR